MTTSLFIKENFSSVRDFSIPGILSHRAIVSERFFVPKYNSGTALTDHEIIGLCWCAEKALNRFKKYVGDEWFATLKNAAEIDKKKAITEAFAAGHITEFEQDDIAYNIGLSKDHPRVLNATRRMMKK